MNRAQRFDNRLTAADLARTVRNKRNVNHICENCGKPGGHWAAFPWTLEDIVQGRPPDGVWLCSTTTSKGGE